MEFLEDQQHTESSEWTVDTKDCGKFQLLHTIINKNKVHLIQH